MTLGLTGLDSRAIAMSAGAFIAFTCCAMLVAGQDADRE